MQVLQSHPIVGGGAAEAADVVCPGDVEVHVTHPVHEDDVVHVRVTTDLDGPRSRCGPGLVEAAHGRVVARSLALRAV